MDELGIKYHKKGTIVTIEGPRFSTKAEAHMHRQWGVDVINMTSVPEVSHTCDLETVGTLALMISEANISRPRSHRTLKQIYAQTCTNYLQ